MVPHKQNSSVCHSDLTIGLTSIFLFSFDDSEREPGQVFTLLETIYRAMDKAAKVFGVFKVETVGDCYVAACGSKWIL